MNVLQDKRKPSLAPITLTRFADGARGRVCPERFVICAAIVITGETKTGRRPENKQRGRKRHPIGNPGGLDAEHCVRRRAEKFRRIKRRKIMRSAARVKIMLALKRRPRRIKDERRQAQKYKKRMRPPRAAPHRFTERAFYRKTYGRHSFRLKSPNMREINCSNENLFSSLNLKDYESRNGICQFFL